jgi:methionine synthase II (cobalamin-independent)
MTRRATPPFRADHVGSLLRPAELLGARDDFAAGTIDAVALTAAEDTAIRDAVKLQEGVGLTKTPELESKDTLKRRIDEAAKYVDLDRLCISGQCGFASTVEGNALTIDEERAKLELLVETAGEVWG